MAGMSPESPFSIESLAEIKDERFSNTSKFGQQPGGSTAAEDEELIRQVTKEQKERKKRRRKTEKEARKKRKESRERARKRKEKLTKIAQVELDASTKQQTQHIKT